MVHVFDRTLPRLRKNASIFLIFFLAGNKAAAADDCLFSSSIINCLNLVLFFVGALEGRYCLNSVKTFDNRFTCNCVSPPPPGHPFFITLGSPPAPEFLLILSHWFYEFYTFFIMFSIPPNKTPDWNEIVLRWFPKFLPAIKTNAVTFWWTQVLPSLSHLFQGSKVKAFIRVHCLQKPRLGCCFFFVLRALFRFIFFVLKTDFACFEILLSLFYGFLSVFLLSSLKFKEICCEK